MTVPPDTTAAIGDAAAAAAAGSASGASAGTTTPPAATTPPDAAAAAAAATLAAQTAETARIAAAAKPVELALPKDAVLTAEHLAAVKAFAAENKLAPEVAQKVLDQQNATVAARLTADAKAFEALMGTWPAEIKADKEIGGEHYDQTIQLRDKVLASFASEKLMAGLKQSGLINDPEMVRMWARIGKASSEDTLHGRGTGAGTQRTPAEIEAAQLRVLYPSMHKAG